MRNYFKHFSIVSKKNKIMSSRGETSNKEGQAKSPLVLWAMQQQFDRMDVLFNVIRDRIDRQDAIIATWREGHPQGVPNVLKASKACAHG